LCDGPLCLCDLRTGAAEGDSTAEGAADCAEEAVSKSSIKVRRSRVIYFRISLADYDRLQDIAKAEEIGITDLMRSYVSVALRQEGLEPLNQVPYNFKGRYRGPNVRRR
jgi:hypothetical protein